jgi:hypothetical protein
VTPTLFSPGLGKGGFWVIYNKAEGFP